MRSLLSGIALTALAACQPTAAPPLTEVQDFAPEIAPSASPEETGALAAAGNRFSISLYREIAAKPGNVILSPVSVSGAFALLQPGARGETATELAATLGFGAVPADRFAPAMGALLARIETEVAPLPQPAEPPPYGSAAYWDLKNDPAATFTIANAAWVRTGYVLQDAYRAVIEANFRAAIASTDFSDPAGAAGRINGWVAANTNDRIKELVTAESIDPDMTRLILTNAVWFKAKWRDAFNPDVTEASEFFGRSGAPMPASLMRRTGDMPYLDGTDFGAIDLAYTNPDFALTLILPDAKDGLPALETRLATDGLLAALTEIQSSGAREVVLTLPKLSVEGSYGLGAGLQALGARRAFTAGAADFSGLIDANEPLHVDEVRHVTWFQMDETTTEAAAATSIEMVATSAPMIEEPPVIFRADHPFLLILRHKPTGAILFIGRIESV